MSDQEKIMILTKALEFYANQKDRVETWCDGDHSGYATFHVGMFDVSCKKCGRSSDGPPPSSWKEVPAKSGEVAREALNKLHGE